jgi:predicted dehydrogenase
MSYNLSSKNIVLFGAGPMAIAYTKVLKHLNVDFTVVGRSKEGTIKFKEQTGIEATPNGVSGWLKKGNTKADYGIIAVSFECLANTAIELMEAGIRKVLLEKPAGLTAQEIKSVYEKAKETGTQIFVGYNRRFYSSVLRAQEMIKNDGGVKSFNFEFTEWNDKVKNHIKNSYVLKNWFLANSSHVVDLAFFLGGKPMEFQSYIAGGSDWHPTATIFSGAGTTHQKALFSYQANWSAPGRWGVEILTCHNRFILSPLEKLQVQKLNSLHTESIDIDDQLDFDFKPGVYRQTKSFLKEDANPALLDIHEHYENVTACYEKMVRPLSES